MHSHKPGSGQPPPLTRPVSKSNVLNSVILSRLVVLTTAMQITSAALLFLHGNPDTQPGPPPPVPGHFCREKLFSLREKNAPRSFPTNGSPDNSIPDTAENLPVKNHPGKFPLNIARKFLQYNPPKINTRLSGTAHGRLVIGAVFANVNNTLSLW